MGKVYSVRITAIDSGYSEQFGPITVLYYPLMSQLLENQLIMR